jgi:hypothetical protein
MYRNVSRSGKFSTDRCNKSIVEVRLAEILLRQKVVKILFEMIH